ncbi:MAG: hypothetical protein M1608_11760 [Candidatus Omnitrophica bacterium]|nr:hypothetical protein [Candidatus Omnitrophota bacterium]
MARFGLDAVKDLAPTDVGPSPELARYIRDRIPPGGLFAGLKWRISSTPFVLGPALMAELEMMGRVLLQFHRSANRLYRESVMGQQPAWVAEWLDRGKSEQLVQWQRSPALKNDIPRVIRPDLLLTEDGLCLVELDSVPGGIGLTAWLNETYARAGAQTVGGADGMLLGFASQFGNAPRVHIVLSDEAGTYRPEMQWLCQRLNQMPGLSSQFEVREVSYRDFGDGDAVYRFFELFDLANVPNAALLFERAISNRLRVTPPPKPIFEEKMLFALLWNWNLREFWRLNWERASSCECAVGCLIPGWLTRLRFRRRRPFPN